MKKNKNNIFKDKDKIKKNIKPLNKIKLLEIKGCATKIKLGFPK